MLDVRLIATACTTYRIDHGTYPDARNISEVEPFLVPTYIKSLPKEDAWGHPIHVQSTSQGLLIASQAEARQTFTEPGRGEVNDTTAWIVFLDGEFVEWPSLKEGGGPARSKGYPMELGWLFWPLVGALIGLAAAQKRGFSVAGGVLGGLLLGPLAVLMFAISGVARGDERKKCPYCTEWIKKEAVVCPHCQRDLASQTQPDRERVHGTGGVIPQSEGEKPGVISRTDARLAQLEKLASMRGQGVLTEEEFQTEKARVLGTTSSGEAPGSPPPRQVNTGQNPNATCTSCGKTFAVPPERVGHVMRCPHCSKVVPTKGTE